MIPPINAYDMIQPVVDTLIKPLLKEKFPDAKQGYLKINIYELYMPSELEATIFLRDDYDTSNLVKDIRTIKKIPGVTNAHYVSKEMAKEKYLTGENEDWDKILTENPLPSSIEVKIDSQKISPEYYEIFSSEIEKSVLFVSDISFPSDILKQFKNNYFILEYNRY